MARYLNMLYQKTPDPEIIDRIMEGSVDMHIHFKPDPGTIRRYDGVQMAEEAAKLKMGGIVLKSHHVPSISVAVCANRLVPEVKTFGSFVIDPPSGGLTEMGVEALLFNAKMGAKVVWFPLESQWAHDGNPLMKDVPGLYILDDRKDLKPIVYDFLKIIKDYDLVLCNGHLSFEESMVLFREAKKMGISKLVATHVFFETIWPPYTMEQAIACAEAGAYLEHCYRECEPLLGSTSPEEYVECIRKTGAERNILSTDFGQITDSSPAEGMRTFVATMLQLGISPHDVELMAKVNPCRLLDMEYTQYY